MLIVGSRALKVHKPDVEPNDWDVVCYKNDISYLELFFPVVEVLKDDEEMFAYKSSANILVECLLADNNEALQGYLKYEKAEGRYDIKPASLETLFSLKKSHIHFPRLFQKHIESYVWLKNRVREDKLPELTKLNYQAAEARLGKLKTPSLNKTVEEFFGQSEGKVRSWFVHDDIHVVMAHKERPMYEYMQRDPSLAKCERDLWEKFTYSEKIQCVLEEAYVIALERMIIPFVYGGGKYVGTQRALEWALMRICTTLTSGWFRQFATDNYVIIRESADPNFDLMFFEKVSEGKVRYIDNKPNSR